MYRNRDEIKKQEQRYTGTDVYLKNKSVARKKYDLFKEKVGDSGDFWSI